MIEASQEGLDLHATRGNRGVGQVSESTKPRADPSTVTRDGVLEALRESRRGARAWPSSTPPRSWRTTTTTTTDATTSPTASQQVTPSTPPTHLDVEVVSALRWPARVDAALERAVPAALAHPASFPIRRADLPPLLERVWELRHNVSAYDAAYVALTERVGAVLITCDTCLVAASGPRRPFDLID